MKQLPIRVRLTAWYLAVVCVVLFVSSVGMYVGIRDTMQRQIDYSLGERVQEMKAFLSRHRQVDESDMPEHFRRSSEVQPSEELFEVADSSGKWIYQAPLMERLHITPSSPDLERQPYYETLSRRRGNLRVLSSTVEVSGQKYFVQVAAIIQPMYDILRGIRFAALWTLPIVLIVAGAGGYWLSGRAMKPVYDIASAAQGISERNLSMRLSVSGANDELRHLSVMLNGMLARLDNAFARVTRFTSDASHELRTPISVIRTTAEVILNRPRSVEEYEELVGQIRSESEYTSELIEDLLTLARADVNPASLELAPIDARQIVDEVIAGSRALAASRDLTFTAQIEPGSFIVSADRQSLKRLLVILIDNAVKYTPANGEVRVSLTSNGTRAIFEVKDSGIGIAKEDLPYIFDRFYRASNARDSGVEGTGLGLAIADWIATAHNSKLEVDSIPSAGTIFRMVLPLSNPVAKP
jgi:heavy metal sensor kinase